MHDADATLFSAELWRPALEKFGVVTHLTVALYDLQSRIVSDPVPSSELFALLQEHGYAPALFAACAAQCVAEADHVPAILRAANGLAVVGAPLRLDESVKGAAVAGYALADFCQSTAIAALARDAGIPFTRLWDVARRQQPVPNNRLMVYGELLQVVGDTILRERDRSRQHEASAARLELSVRERTADLMMANTALASEVCERRDAEARVRRVLARLITVQEDERRRIARDLHDHLGQQMTALHLTLQALKNAGPTPLDEPVSDLQARFVELDRDLRFFTRELRPGALYELGLASALVDLVTTFADSYRLPATFEAVGMPPARLVTDIEINLYRIAQEALNNAYKHAHARKVDVFLQYRDGNVVLSVMDDGVGFESDQPRRAPDVRAGLGLTGMRERAALVDGMLHIESAPGQGTSVIISVPARLADRPTDVHERRDAGAGRADD